MRWGPRIPSRSKSGYLPVEAEALLRPVREVQEYVLGLEYPGTLFTKTNLVLRRIR